MIGCSKISEFPNSLKRIAKSFTGNFLYKFPYNGFEGRGFSSQYWLKLSTLPFWTKGTIELFKNCSSFLFEKNKNWRHSSVDSSTPSILPPWVWVPSTPSTLLSIYIWFESCRKDENKQKEAGIGPFLYIWAKVEESNVGRRQNCFLNYWNILMWNIWESRGLPRLSVTRFGEIPTSW